MGEDTKSLSTLTGEFTYLLTGPLSSLIIAFFIPIVLTFRFSYSILLSNRYLSLGGSESPRVLEGSSLKSLANVPENIIASLISPSNLYFGRENKSSASGLLEQAAAVNFRCSNIGFYLFYSDLV